MTNEELTSSLGLRLVMRLLTSAARLMVCPFCGECSLFCTKRLLQFYDPVHFRLFRILASHSWFMVIRDTSIPTSSDTASLVGGSLTISSINPNGVEFVFVGRGGNA